MNKHGSTTRAREKAEFLLKSGIIENNQPVMCAFGEIDCRVHVIPESEKYNGDFKPVINNIIANYLEFLDFLSREHPVYIWGPIASQKDNWHINPEFPHNGTETQRNRATEYFNNRLEELCRERGFKYFSIFRYLIDSSYRTKSKFISSDQCHLSQRAWIFAAEEFRKQGINIMFKSEWLENFDMASIPVKKPKRESFILRLRKKLRIRTRIKKFFSR